VNAKLKGLKKLTTFERQYQCADGRIIAAEVHETPIVDKAGAIQGIRTCLIDLTERYQTRERLDRYANELQEKNAALAQALRAAQEATRLKSQFLANMSHEIRTPLNGVLGMTELLLGSGLGPEQCELAACVLQSGEHLLSVINDILDVSKIEAGKFELEKASFDLPAVVESAMELMAPAAYAKNVELSCWIAPEIPESLLGDGSRLRQVLLNLVGNAVKFTKEGEVSVRVMCERVGGPEVTIHVTVADTGIGIPGDARSRLFSAFTQADSSTTRKYGGTGLGLTIAQRIVNLMGGAIGLDSVEGQGSTFWFTCKFGKGVSSVPKPYDASLAGVKVLIADDNATSRSALESYARHWGMLPELVGSGAEALERMRQRACL
jgi:signal transduction histidine kinase